MLTLLSGKSALEKKTIIRTAGARLRRLLLTSVCALGYSVVSGFEPEEDGDKGSLPSTSTTPISFSSEVWGPEGVSSSYSSGGGGGGGSGGSSSSSRSSGSEESGRAASPRSPWDVLTSDKRSVRSSPNANVEQCAFLKDVPLEAFRYNTPFPEMVLALKGHDTAPQEIEDTLGKAVISQLQYGDDMIGLAIPGAALESEAFRSGLIKLGKMLLHPDVQESLDAQENMLGHRLIIEGPVSEEGALAFLQHIERLPKEWNWVQDLRWSRSSLGEIAALADGVALQHLSKLPTIRHLVLTHNGLKETHIRPLLEQLGRRATPLAINLGHNPLGEAGGAVVRTFLTTSESCQYMGLRATGLTDGALRALQEMCVDRIAVEDEVTPLEVDTSANPIGEAMHRGWHEALTSEAFGEVREPRYPASWAAYEADRALAESWETLLPDREAAEVTLSSLEGMTARSLQEMTGRLLQMPHLTRLTLKDMPLPAEGMAALKPLFTSGKLAHLGLVNVGLTADHLAPVDEALFLSPTWQRTLMSLDISRNQAGPTLLRTLKAVTKRAIGLEKLNVAGNKLAQNVRPLVLSLASHPRLKHLDIQANYAADRELVKLWENLTPEARLQGKFRALQHVDISYNPANMEVTPDKLPEGVTITFKGLGAPTHVLKAWYGKGGYHSLSHRKGLEEHTLQALYAGMLDYIPASERPTTDEAKTTLFKRNGLGENLLKALHHVRFTHEEEHFKLHLLLPEIAQAETVVLYAVDNGVKDPLKALLERSNDSLKTFEHYGNRWARDFFQPIIDSWGPSLERLVLCNSSNLDKPNTEALMNAMARCQQLKRVKFDNFTIDKDVSSERLMQLPHLRHLTLTNNSLQPNTPFTNGLKLPMATEAAEGEEAAAGSKLEKLTISNNPLGKSADALAASLPAALAKLRLENIGLAETGVRALSAALSRLGETMRTIDLSRNIVLADNLPQLSPGLRRLKNLRQLRIAGFAFSPNSAANLPDILEQFEHLHTVALHNVNIHEEDPQRMREQLEIVLDIIQELSLTPMRGKPIDPNIIVEISKPEDIDKYKQYFTTKVGRHNYYRTFITRRHESHPLDILSVDGNDLRGDLGPALGLMFYTLKESPLREVYVNRLEINDAHVRALAKGVVGSQIESIYISYHGGSIGSKALTALANALPLSRVKSLAIYDSNIGVQGTTILARVLPSSKIESLYLGRYNMGDEGAIALSEALSSSKVKKCYLQAINIGDEGAKALATLLKTRKVIEMIVQNNNLSEAGKRALQEAKEAVQRDHPEWGFNWYGW